MLGGQRNLGFLGPAVLLLCACRSAPAPAPAGGDEIERLASLPQVEEVAISPDGTRVAYVSDASGVPDLWVDGKPRAQIGETVTHPRFAPDGKTLYFLADHGGDERYDLWRVGVDEGAPAQVTKTAVAETEFAISRDGKWLAFTADPEREFVFELHVLELATGKVTQLTHEGVNLVSPVWSADDAFLAATRTGDDQAGPMLVIELKTGQIRRFEPKGKGAILRPVAFAPDGATILVRTLDDAGFLQLATVSSGDGVVTQLTRTPGDVEHAVAGPERIVYARNDRGVSRIHAMDWSGSPAPALLPEGVILDLAGDRNASRVAAAIATSNAPPLVHLSDLALADRLVGTTVEASGPAAQLVEWTSDRETISGLLTRPADARLGTPPPLVVRVHGGPNGQARPEFFLEVQALALAGFAVLQPNYRGSTGFGRAFEDANNLDWGGGDLRDVVAGVKWAVSQGFADPARVGIFGGSYGGYLTLRALTAAPDVFAAGVESFGMPDLVEDYELTKERFGDWYATEMGTPATQPALFRDRSPIHALDRMKTPLLVLQGENDTNVPKAESELVVAKLRERGHPVEYVLYPDEGHGFTRRVTRVDATRRLVAFMRTHLAPRR